MVRKGNRKIASPDTSHVNCHVDKRKWALVQFYATINNKVIDEALEDLIVKGWEKVKDEEEISEIL